MKYKKLGKTNICVSEIGVGSLSVGPHQLNLSAKDGGEVIKYALESGFNLIDTAEYYMTYPHIEYALSNSSLKSPPVICSKSLDGSYQGMRESVKNAIESLSLKNKSINHGEFIDIFLLHEIRSGGKDQSISGFELRSGAWEYLKEAKSKGLVKAIGISTHHIDVAENMIDNPDCDIVFPLINFASLGIRKYDGKGTNKEMAKAIKNLSLAGKGIFTMKTFGGGPLIKDYIKALDYNTNLEGAASAVIGFGSKAEVDNALSYLNGALPQAFTPDFGKKIMRVEYGSCEGCGACVERCPNKAITLSTSMGIAKIDPKKCMCCGYCAPVCPVRALVYY